jgi:imidazolonepropionase-like amidohydrolase
VLIDGLGGPPQNDSVVVVAGGRIREAGARSTVLLPAEADKVDGSGKFLAPAPIDIYASAEAASRQARATHLWKMDRAALDAARDAGIPVVGHVSTESGVRALVDGGAAGFIGMMVDTEELDPALVSRLRDLRIFFAPALVSQGATLEVAQRNTRRLFSAGVDAGIPPLDAIVAATRNSAAALGQLNEAGTVQAGKRADLLLLSANPGEDIRNLRKVALRMSAGNWVK